MIESKSKIASLEESNAYIQKILNSNIKIKKIKLSSSQER